MRRAIWITRFDWDTEADLRRLARNAIRVGFTDLLMQVRGAGDALYRSSVAPTSPKIAGRLGGHAAWDPLDVVVTEARREAVRVHAWLNVLSGWPATSDAGCAGLVESLDGEPDHLLIHKPELLLLDEVGRPMPCPNAWDYQWLSPRDPVVEADIRTVVSELCDAYPVDGVHLDRIRYPGGPWRDPGFEDRSPEAVTRLVRAVRQLMPGSLELTCSLAPDYLAVDDGGDPEHLVEYGQDGWKWVHEKLVDGIMPMVYTPVLPGAVDDWRRLVRGHVDAVGADKVWAPIYADLPVAQIERQISEANQIDGADVAWYSAGLIERNGHWGRVETWLRRDM